ncbi:MAG: alkaline phosphatase [Planctomycetota bacterium]
MSDQQTPTDRLDRRSFFGLMGLGVVAGGVGLAGAGQPPKIDAPRATPTRPGVPSASHTRGKPKNIILMVSDGMSVGTLQLAELFRNLRDGTSGAWAELIRRDDSQRSIFDTTSANGFVTDSGAAVSAWSLGKRCNNGVLSVLPDGSMPDPLFVRARAIGKATGHVTTTHLQDATPAGFIANSEFRRTYDSIAQQYLERGFDVALGGGGEHFTSLLLERHPSVNLATNKQALTYAQSLGNPILGCFMPGMFDYAIDRGDDSPTLAEMTSAALAHLEKRGGDEGFLAIIEAARVDHAAHANDLAAIIHDQIEFDDAVRAATEFMEDRDDTLLIVTTDHANANPGISSYAEKGIRQFERVLEAQHSFAWINQRFAEIPESRRDAHVLTDLVNAATGVELRNNEIDFLKRMLRGEPVHPYASADKPTSILGALLTNHFGVAWASPNHTSDHVICTSVGVGASRVPAMGHLTDLHDAMVALAGIPVSVGD